MFCKICGAQTESDFCPQCAAKQAAPQQTPAAPGNFVGVIKKNLHLITAAVAALALIFGILITFGVFHVYVTASAYGEKESNYTSVSETIDGLETLDGSFAAGVIGNILFGLANLGIAAIGALYFLKVAKNMPFYDKFIGSKLKFGPVFIMGALGAVGALLQVILYLFCTAKLSFFGITMKVSCGVNWTTWLLFAIYAVLAAADKLVLDKKN